MHRSHLPGDWFSRFGRPAVALAAVAAAVSATVAVPAVASAAPPDHAAPASPAGSALAKAAAPKPPPAQRQGVVPGQVLVTLDPGTSVTGSPIAGSRLAARLPDTSSSALDARLRAAGATALRPLLPGLTPAAADGLTQAARTRLGAGAQDLGDTYVLQTKDKDSAAVARALRGVPGVALAEPDRYVNTMNSGAQPLPSAALAAARTAHPAANPAANPAGKAPASTPADAAGVPANYALSTSSQALLNAGGVDAVGAFSLLQGGYGRQPGAGETITNVSVGDLTDQSMADAGDSYVQSNGPTTVLSHGRRYLDLPSMPLIPTYVAKDSGGLDAAASTEGQDPSLGEVMLDFGVMAPLPDGAQRPGATGSGYTDLLGIAPGADYRLVVPEQPTTDRIAGALLAAAHQSPRPDVITASLGFGTDAQGLPGRYLEDDPVVRSVVASIVQRDGIVVSISSNDGTRLYTPASVGPDGGSTPTDTVRDPAGATTIDDDAATTTPSLVPDSGAIAAGGSTLDDTLAQGASGPATTAETRISGFGTFSSGFGSRVDVSAPSDNVIAVSHAAGGGPSDVDVSLNGGTSASAPEIAAAAAVVLQAGRLGGHPLTPAGVREVLERTGRAVATPPQIDRTLQVGPQIDVTAAVERVLGRKAPAHPSIVRLSVAHRTVIGGLGGAFLETSDQDRIDLGDRASGGDGEGLVGPVTFAADVTGLDGAPASYRLTVGRTVFRSGTPAIRVTPARLLAAAGLPVVSAADRQVTVDYAVVSGGRTVATERRTLTVGPSDGGYAEAQAPVAPAVAAAGHAVTVTYDLTGVAGLDDPQLVVSGVGHWNPVLGPVFSAAWHRSLTAPRGTVTIPAAAFDGGGGIYGIGVAQSAFGGNPQYTAWGEFAPIRIGGATAAERPVAPLLTGTGAGTEGTSGHTAEVTSSAPRFTLAYDARAVHGARYAEVEFSAPAPTLHNSLNTFTNANGTGLDDDGVNTPSTAHRVLPAAAGTVRLDALALGLSSSEVYGVRVLALDRDHHVLGQASALSSLAVDDGLAPAGGTVLSFATAGPHSVAALRTAAGGTEVRTYDPSTGRYGPVLASDPGTDSDYEVVGATAGRVLLVHRPDADAPVRVETWNTTTGVLVGARELGADAPTFVVGRVDAAHGRGALLLRSADNADMVLPVDLASGAVGAPIPADPADVPAGTYSLLAFDASSGAVYLAKGAQPFLCLGGVTVARVDLTARTVSAAGTSSGCSHGFGSDDAGHLYNLSAIAGSTKIVPNGVLTPLDEATGEQGDTIPVRQGAPVALAVDGVHHLALVSYDSPAGTAYFGSQHGLVLDNNATGQILVVDLTTGTVVRTLTGFAVDGHGGPLVHGGEMNSIQLDPATRTAYTYAAYDAQIQRFTY
jgi:hypothetical protein